MVGHLIRIFKELRLLGIKSTFSRVNFEFKRRTGIDRALKKRRILSVPHYKKNCSISFSPDFSYMDFWHSNKLNLGIPNSASARDFLHQLLDDNQKKALIGRAESIGENRFQQFGCNWVQHEDIDWYCDPDEGLKWPKEHSSKLLLKLADYGDIKLVWELGRFTWVLDLVRAWLVSDDDSHIDTMFRLIDDFIDNNPLYVGPHWTSEQEVAIRALMLVYILEVLRHHEYLDEQRLLTMHALLELHGIYLEQNLEYAEIAIRNNHLIYGAVGLYAISSALPCHKDCDRWHKRSRIILKEAAEEQWFPDGGYVQPSHNYHRSAWHGMLWARMIALELRDNDLVTGIDRNLERSLQFFVSQMDPASGRLPNWGPNDGALIGSWTECNYTDYRPLVQTLSLIGRGVKAFSSGPWDEEAFWFIGRSALECDVKPICVDSNAHFIHQGLYVFRHSPSNYSVMRSGNILSRYGQQADQLHVDIWSGGRNIAIDAGSYNYNRSLSVHNWFRGTLSHNTVIVGEVDQMIPHRTFKYLNWTKGFAKQIDLNNYPSIVGVHDGYTRLEGKWCHARVLTYIDSSLFILDRVWPLRPTAESTKLRLHWQFDLEIESLSEDAGVVNINCDHNRLLFLCSQNGANFSATRGSQEPFDGWVSRHYNTKSAVQAINYSTRSNEETWFLSIVSDQNWNSKINFESSYIEIDGLKRINLQTVRTSSDEMMKESLTNRL
jgi:hypothetical protein